MALCGACAVAERDSPSLSTTPPSRLQTPQLDVRLRTHESAARSQYDMLKFAIVDATMEDLMKVKAKFEKESTK